MATEKILDFFFHMDFFKDKKPITKTFYLFYTLGGGIYYESYVRQWFRYCTKTYLIVSVIFIETNSLITLYRLGTTNLSLSLYCGAFSYVLLITFLNVVIYHYWLENVRSFIESTNTYTGMYEDHNAEIYNIVDCNKYFKFRYAFILILFGLFNTFSKCIIFCLTVKDSSKVDPLYNYIHPLVFPTEVNRLEYVLLTCLLSFLALSFCMYLSITPLITLLISIYLKNIATSLKTDMKLVSNIISTSLDTSYENEMAILDAQSCIQHKYEEFRHIEETRKLCYEKLESYVYEWVQRYQKLILEMNTINGFLAGVSSLGLMGATISLLTICYGSILTIGGRSFELVSVIPYYMLFILVICINGHLYGSMMDDLKEEIYEIPWHYLPPIQRRLILNFLTIVQKPRILKALKVYPIMLRMYPRILMNVFSYLQIMKVVEQKVQI